MAKSDFEVVVVGGGAAGIGAARKLHESGVNCLLVEARDRLGGRAWTIGRSGFTLDLGWLHSADRNAWRDIAEGQGCTIDQTPPPWARSIPVGFAPGEQKAFAESLRGFWRRAGEFPEAGPDAPATSLIEPGDRWNGL